MENEPVVIQAIMLSDSVIREVGTGKVSLIGCFSIWNASSFPLTVPRFYITPFLSNFRKAVKDISITLRIETPEKHVIWSATGKIGFVDDGNPLPNELLVELPFQVDGVAFPQAGRYVCRVIIDGDEIGQRDFFVRSLTARA